MLSYMHLCTNRSVPICTQYVGASRGQVTVDGGAIKMDEQLHGQTKEELKCP